MAIPDKIPVARIEEYHTHYVGTMANAIQFWGYDTFLFENMLDIVNPDWQSKRKEYIVLHTFDSEGNHLGTRHFFNGTTNSLSADPQQILESWLSEFEEVEFGDIEIKPFQTEIDGTVFGLIPDDEIEALNLEPSNTISFMAPWDGEYDT